MLLIFSFFLCLFLLVVASGPSRVGRLLFTSGPSLVCPATFVLCPASCACPCALQCALQCALPRRFARADERASLVRASLVCRINRPAAAPPNVCDNGTRWRLMQCRARCDDNDVTRGKGTESHTRSAHRCRAKLRCFFSDFDTRAL